MHLKQYRLLVLFLTIIFLSSCTSYKKIGYIKNADEMTLQQLSQNKPKDSGIMPGDMLTIYVNTINPTAAVPFNLPLMPVVNSGLDGIQNTVGTQAFLVDKDGCVNFPVIGRISLEGKTRIEAEEFIQSAIYPKYITESPIVTVRFVNNRIYVLGEVNRPGAVSYSQDRINILEALAMAGDLTIFGKRDNVLLRREYADGTSEVVRLNLQDKEILLSPYFHLQQNDVIYIESNRAKGNSASIGATENLTISVVSILVSVATLLITVFK